MARQPGVAGILLTGGASSRMGSDKASLRLDGTTQAVRMATLLRAVVDPVIEVGPNRSGLAYVEEEPKGEGPLVAVAAGAAWLRQHGHDGTALVLACDLPLLTAAVLELLASWPGDTTVLPLVDGHDQPLCARWSALDLAASATAVANGERSLRRLPERATADLLAEETWSAIAAREAFADVDTPADLAALGLTKRLEVRGEN